MLDYFLDLIDNINSFLPKIKECTQKESNINSDNVSKNKVDIQIPNELYIYDRIYKFEKQERASIFYANNQDGENTLEVKIDPNHSTLTGINIEMLTARNVKYTLNADYDKDNQIKVKVVNDRKARFKLSPTNIMDAPRLTILASRSSLTRSISTS